MQTTKSTRHPLHRLALALTLCLAANAVFAGVRISAADFANNPQKVTALTKAVTTLRSRNTANINTADYRGSWTYWAATHGYFGQGPNSSGSAAQFIAAAPQICNGLPQNLYNICLTYYPHVKDLALPTDGFTGSIWGTCQHSDPSKGPSQANLQFLTWHRMYLYYFERVLRKASGDPAFTLPYWNYQQEKGPGGNGLALPKLVRGNAAGTLNDTFRTPGLNENTGAINANAASAVQAFKFNDFRNFSFQLEMQPHGQMHCATGFRCQAPDMGIVPVAGLDPVFYMHHANIDRLWQCWMVKKAHGQPIDLAWAKANLGMPDSWFNQTFDFVDENGAKATLSVKDIFNGKIDSSYDKTTDCVPTPVVLAAATTPKIAPLSSKATVSLRGEAQSVELAPSAALEAPALQEFAVEPGKTLLIIQDVELKGSPGVTYDIYIHRKGAPDKSEFVATINYFGLIGPHHAGHTPESKIKTLFYDIGDEIARLGLPAGDAADVAVRFVPHDDAGAAASVRKDAGSLEVGSIRVQTTTGDATPVATQPLPQGKWTYRSFINRPEFVAGNANKALALIFAEATMSFEPVGADNKIKGVLDMGGGYFLDLSGTWIPAQEGYPATAEIAGIGRTGTPTADWEYDYHAFLVPNWPNGIDQRPAFVGSVIRAKPHGTAKAGYTASFIAVQQ